MAMTDAIRILICEDDSKLRRVLAVRLASQPDIEVAGQTASAERALALLDEGLSVDLVLLDLELPGMHGLEFLGIVAGRAQRPDILILTSFSDQDTVFEAIQRGASGYLVKTAGLDRLAQCIRDIHKGGTVLEPVIAKRFWNLFRANRGHAPTSPYDLTDDELEILHLLAKGLTNPEMSQTLGIGRRNVKSTLETIYRKMSVENRVEAVVAALQAGLITV